MLERFLKRLIAQYQLDECELLGLTSMFSQNVASFALARLVKAKNPAVVTVMGGANCEGPMGAELVRNVEAIDYTFSGPALVSFPSFVAHQMAGERDACDRLRGVFSAASATPENLVGARSIGEERPIELAVPLEYETFLAELEASFPERQVEPYLTFETSRGCWWGERSHCTFCGLNGGTMAYRAMPSPMALEHLQSMIDRYGDRCRHFESVDNILPREYLREVFPVLETPPGVEVFYEVKADLKESEIAVLGRAGVTAIQPGIESLATSTLKLMGKGTTAFQNLAFLKNCVLYGIRPSWNLLIGFPSEQPGVYEKYLADLPLLGHLPPPSGAFPVRFDRFSPYFTRAASYGLELSPYAFYSFIYPFDSTALANIAYYFEDRNYNAQYLANLVAWQNKLTAATQEWINRWRGLDGKPQARLYLERRDDGGMVIDVRSGLSKEIPIDVLELALLEVTDLKGWRAADIAKQIGAEEPQIARAIERLRGAGLLFEENERYLSIVLDRERREQARAMVSTGSEANTASVLDAAA